MDGVGQGNPNPNLGDRQHASQLQEGHDIGGSGDDRDVHAARAAEAIEAAGAEGGMEETKGEGAAGEADDDADPEAREEPGAREAFKDPSGAPLELEIDRALFYPEVDVAMAILNKVRGPAWG